MISPAMVDTVSQLRVSMNQEVIGTVPLQKYGEYGSATQL